MDTEKVSITFKGYKEILVAFPDGTERFCPGKDYELTQENFDLITVTQPLEWFVKKVTEKEVEKKIKLRRKR